MGRPGPGQPRSALLVEEGLLGVVPGQFLAPQADVMGTIREGRVAASRKNDFSPPNVFPAV